MDANLLEGLLFEAEGETLDFKEQQYRFSGATEIEKSEILKDFLGFANAWRRSDAYILIGVREVRGSRSVIVGTENHLEDHDLQQFVSTKTNVPLRFSYAVCTIDEKQVGVIRIEMQVRPVFLKKDYGKLKKNEVYVRRGSSTDFTKPATPDEIAKMGFGISSSVNEVELSVEFAELDREISLGNTLSWSAIHLGLPEEKKIPLIRDEPESITIGGQKIQIPSLTNLSSLSGFERLNKTFYRDYSEYEFYRNLVKPIRLVVTNSGQTVAADVQVEISVANGSGIRALHNGEIPDKPQRVESTIGGPALKNFRPRRILKEAGDVSIESNEHLAKIAIECGVLQPGRKIWTDAFLIGIGESGDYTIAGTLFSSNLNKPKEFELAIEAEIAKQPVSVEELKKLANENTTEE